MLNRSALYLPNLRAYFRNRRTLSIVCHGNDALGIVTSNLQRGYKGILLFRNVEKDAPRDLSGHVYV